jgi:tripartite-type tricarboxylate transporter receptor subunit TctC
LKSIHKLWIGVVAIAATVLPLSAAAADYPTHSLRLVVPFPPGGNIDFTGRLIAIALGEALGQTVVVTNTSGAGGLIGAGLVARAAPDGYTLLLGSTASITTAPAVNQKVSFDPIKDLFAVGGIQTVPLVLTTSSKLPVNDFAELIAYSQANGPVAIAASGVGSPAHLAIELMTRQSKLQALYVPYQGSGPALTDLLAGRDQAMTDQINSSMPYIRDGRLKVVAQLGRKRSFLLPNVPTLEEQGLPGFDAVTFTGLFAPANMPPAVRERLVTALGTAMKDSTLRTRFTEIGAEIMEMTQPEFAQFVAADYAKWRTVARDAKIMVP